ncbi:unnamed protein product [Oikopleura dioica]|uniref:Uncharacterized protein n=1 Tax=Oikopleura dioica TaxID=34765 RepID=E4YBX2_OIKDI|nr:unnamed protein product [Oikopleura dioica]
MNGGWPQPGHAPQPRPNRRGPGTQGKWPETKHFRRDSGHNPHYSNNGHGNNFRNNSHHQANNQGNNQFWGPSQARNNHDARRPNFNINNSNNNSNNANKRASPNSNELMEVNQLTAIELAELETPSDFDEPKPHTLKVKYKDYDYLSESAFYAIAPGSLIKKSLGLANVIFKKNWLYNKLSEDSQSFWAKFQCYKITRNWWPEEWRGDAFTGQILCRCTLGTLQDFLVWAGINGNEVILLHLVDRDNRPTTINQANTEETCVRGVCFSNMLAYLKFCWFGAKLVATSDPAFRMQGLPFWDNLWLPARSTGEFHLTPISMEEIQTFLLAHANRYWHFIGNDYLNNLTFAKTPKTMSVTPMGIAFDKRIDKMAYSRVSKDRIMGVEPLMFDKQFEIIKDYAYRQRTSKKKYKQSPHDYVRTTVAVIRGHVSREWFTVPCRQFLLNYKEKAFQTAGVAKGAPISVNEVATNPDYDKTDSHISSLKFKAKQDLMRLVGDSEAREILERILSGDATHNDYNVFTKKHSDALGKVIGKVDALQKGLISDSIANRHQFAMTWQQFEFMAKNLQKVASAVNLPEVEKAMHAAGTSAQHLRLAATERAQDITLGFMDPNSRVDESLYQIDRVPIIPLSLKSFNPNTQLTKIVDMGGNETMSELCRGDPMGDLFDGMGDKPALPIKPVEELRNADKGKEPRISVGEEDLVLDNFLSNTPASEVRENQSQYESDLDEIAEENLLDQGSVYSTSADSEVTLVYCGDNRMSCEVELQPDYVPVRSAELHEERNLPQGEVSMTKGEEEEWYFPTVQAFTSLEELITTIKPPVYPTVQEFEAFKKQIKSHKTRLDRQLKSLANEAKVAKLTLGQWLNILVNLGGTLLEELRSFISEGSERCHKNHGIGVDGKTKMEHFIVFRDELATYLDTMYRLDNASTFAITFSDGVFWNLPIPISTGVLGLVQKLGLTKQIPNNPPSSVAISILNGSSLVATSQSSHAAVYFNKDKNILPDANRGEPVTARYIKASREEIKMRGRMVVEMIKSIYIRDHKGEMGVTINHIIEASHQNGEVALLLQEFYHKVIKNQFSGYEKWMTDPNHISNCKCRGFMVEENTNSQNKLQLEQWEGNDDGQKTQLYAQHNEVWIRGIVPRSIITHDSPTPEDFVRFAGMVGILDGYDSHAKKAEGRGTMDKPKEVEPSLIEMEKECNEHNAQMEEATRELSVATVNLGSSGMAKIAEMIDHYPEIDIFCLSELYQKTDILGNPGLWPDGYKFVPSKESPIDRQSFTCIVHKREIEVHSVIEGLHQNVAMNINLNGSKIMVSSLYNFNGGKASGYEKKFSTDNKALFKDLRIIREANTEKSIITGDLNCSVKSPRENEKTLARELNESLAEYSNPVDLATYRRIKKIRGEHVTSESQIDHMFVKGLEVASCEPMNLPAILKNDGHLGILTKFKIPPPRATTKAVWKVPRWVDDETLHVESMMLLRGSTELAMKLGSKEVSAELYAEIATDLVSEYSKRVRPERNLIIESSPFKPIMSQITKKYRTACFHMNSVVLDAVRAGAPQEWIRKLRNIDYKLQLILCKLKGADKRVTLDRKAKEIELEIVDSWKLFDKLVKKANQNSVQTSLEETADALLHLQMSTTPNMDIDESNGLKRRWKSLPAGQKLGIEKFRVHSNSALVPCFTEIYKTCKKTTRDICGVNKVLLETCTVATFRQLIMMPIELSLMLGKYFPCWRANKITPLVKPNLKLRPIVIAAFTGALTEKFITSSLNSFFELRGLVPSQQFGFKSNHSVGAAALSVEKVVNSTIMGYDEGGGPTPPDHSVLSTADARNAFGVVRHDLLLEALGGIVDERALRWFATFLPRTFKVCLRGHYSELRELPPWGLPQGASPSPSLYSFFTSSLLTDSSVGDLPDLPKKNVEQSRQGRSSGSGNRAVTETKAETAMIRAMEAELGKCSVGDHPMVADGFPHLIMKGKDNNGIRPNLHYPVMGNSVVIKSLAGNRVLRSMCLFADDSVMSCVADDENSLRREVTESTTRTYAALTRLGLSIAPEKSESLLFSKSIKPNDFNITSNGEKVKVILKTRYLGIFLSAENGRLTYKAHHKVLKGRFRFTAEKISFLNNIVTAEHRAAITKGIMLGILLFPLDFIAIPENADLNVLQKIYIRSMIGISETRYWERTMRVRNREMIKMYRKKEIITCFPPADPGLEPLDRFGHATLGAMCLKQGFAKIFKVFRSHEPDTAYESLSGCIWVCDSNNLPIARLPDVFECDRKTRKALLRSRFDEGRAPGILTSDESENLYKLRLFVGQVRGIVNAGSLNIRLILPKHNDKPFIISKNQWPYALFEKFNKLPRYVRNDMVNNSFPDTLKGFIGGIHRHWKTDIECVTCNNMAAISRIHNLPSEEASRWAVPESPSTRERLNTIAERIANIEVVQNESAWEEVLWRWWFPFSLKSTWVSPESFMQFMLNEAFLTKLATKNQLPKERDLVKRLLSDKQGGLAFNNLYLKARSKFFSSARNEEPSRF